MKKFANQYGYSDVTPFEVVRMVSEKTYEVRRMEYSKDPNWKPEFDVGGFAAHCTNQREQTWIIESNDKNPIIRIRLHKDGSLKDAHGNKFRLADAPRRFYDYNF